MDYDANGLNLTTEYKYNVFGDIVEVKDPNGNVAKSWYNNLRQLTQTESPSPFEYITKYSYDKNGNVKKIERETGDQQSHGRRRSTFMTF